MPHVRWSEHAPAELSPGPASLRVKVLMFCRQDRVVVWPGISPCQRGRLQGRIFAAYLQLLKLALDQRHGMCLRTWH